MHDCIFCQIVSGESSISVFYEDDIVLGIMTIDPVNQGHAMIIPKQHAAYLADLDEETGRHLWTITQRTAAAIRKSGVRCEGINLFLADGEAAFQDIFHVHMHVFPRYKGDSFKNFVLDPRLYLFARQNAWSVGQDLWIISTYHAGVFDTHTPRTDIQPAIAHCEHDIHG